MTMRTVRRVASDGLMPMWRSDPTQLASTFARPVRTPQVGGPCDRHPQAADDGRCGRAAG
jgi:hypothetical protein